MRCQCGVVFFYGFILGTKKDSHLVVVLVVDAAFVVVLVVDAALVVVVDAALVVVVDADLFDFTMIDLKGSKTPLTAVKSAVETPADCNTPKMMPLKESN